jgi:hypothetical protein
MTPFIGSEEFDEDQYRAMLEQSQPSIFEIVLEDLLILKGASSQR